MCLSNSACVFISHWYPGHYVLTFTTPFLLFSLTISLPFISPLLSLHRNRWSLLPLKPFCCSIWCRNRNQCYYHYYCSKYHQQRPPSPHHRSIHTVVLLLLVHYYYCTYHSVRFFSSEVPFFLLVYIRRTTVFFFPWQKQQQEEVWREGNT